MPFVVDDLIYVAMIASLAAAAAQANASKQAVEQQSEAAVQNTQEQYNSASEQERQANVDAAEKLTDRMRDARRQLSAARVYAAEGGGGLRARSENILTSAAEDQSRLVAGLADVRGGIRQDVNIARVSGDAANASFQSQGTAIRTRFMSEVAQIGMSAASRQAAKNSDVSRTTGNTSDYSLARSRVRFGGT